MKKIEIIKYGSNELKKNNININLAKYLYEELFGTTELLSKREEKKYCELIFKIKTGIPIQYVLKKAPFYGYSYKVNKNVLIPRFETELLVEDTINYIKKNFDKHIKIADIGTGSGCIAITMKKEVPLAEVWATDISGKAIKVAKENGKTIDADIKWSVGDLITPLKGEKFDVIISNPPYIKSNEEIDPIVFNYEPKLALLGGDDGLKYYKKLLSEVGEVLNNKFLIALEVSEAIIEDLIIIVKKIFPDVDYIVKKDLSSRIRMLFISNNFD
jgi:release factor glutamine methyltransferase